MNPFIEQAEALRQQAIAILIEDQKAIEAKLAQLGYDGAIQTAPEKKSRACSKCGQRGHSARTCAVTEQSVT